MTIPQTMFFMGLLAGVGSCCAIEALIKLFNSTPLTNNKERKGIVIRLAVGAVLVFIACSI